MSKDVRPRISKKVYQLVKNAATSSGVSENHWLVEAIKEKATKEGFEIIEGQVINIRAGRNFPAFREELEEI